jgi:hypothetical protein
MNVGIVKNFCRIGGSDGIIHAHGGLGSRLVGIVREIRPPALRRRSRVDIL